MSNNKKDIYKHIETLNKEMGIVQTKIEYLEKAIDKIDRRTWWILGTIVILGLANAGLNFLF